MQTPLTAIGAACLVLALLGTLLDADLEVQGIKIPRIGNAHRRRLFGISLGTLGVALLVFALIVPYFAPGVACASTAGTSSLAPTSPAPSSAPPSPTPQTSPAAASPSSATDSPTPAPVMTGPEAGTPLSGPEAPADAIVDYDGNHARTDAQGLKVNGHATDNDFFAYCDGCTGSASAYVIVNLGRSYSTLKALLGIDEAQGQPGGSVEFQLIADGKVIFDASYTLYTSKAITVSVEGVLQLKFRFIGDLGHDNAVVGDPTAYP